VGLKKAVELIGTARPDKIIAGGVAINVLDQDDRTAELTYHHQLLQEYFAGRRLAGEPKPELVSVEWRASEVRPTLAETIASLANGDPLPPPGQTGWEETTLAALPMSKDPEGYVAKLMEHNLPLAARCAISPEVKISEELKDQIRRELIGRTQDKKADLRARIAAGESLGLIGDPRFEVYRGADGECLLPPMVDIPAGTYPIGDDHSGYGHETPAHTVELNAYQIGVYPVTNAEYARFIEAGGYEDERWWDTAAARRWRREGGSENQKQAFRVNRKRWQSDWTDDEISALVGQKRAAEKQVKDFLWLRNSSDEEFERQLDEWFPAGNLDRTPRFWEDASYNNPEQPVVGVSWYEARAYCKWISQVTGVEYRLPTEVEYEAAASGEERREYCYGNEFDSSRCNTFESHIRRPTPVGIFDNRTVEGAYDLTGNVWTWTTTIYDQEKYRYPYRAEDGREGAEAGGGGDEEEAGSKSVRATRRVVRGGGWHRYAVYSRSAYRNADATGHRGEGLGFRLSRTLPLALLPLRSE
jgi:formylglycine-generating enzyme required for sulfatase activity